MRQPRVRALRKLVRKHRSASILNALRMLDRAGARPATIADVGASDGRWSDLALEVFPTAELVLFEPQSVHGPGLDFFQAEHPTATIIRSAVGGTNGSSLFDASDPWGGRLEKAPTTGTITVPVVTLDESLADAKPPFLVKLDTHGVEAEILAGAEEALSRSVAWVIEAVNQRIVPEAMLFWELCAYMADHGFRPVDLIDVMRRPHDGSLWQMDLFFIRSDWEGFDYLGYT